MLRIRIFVSFTRQINEIVHETMEDKVKAVVKLEVEEAVKVRYVEMNMTLVLLYIWLCNPLACSGPPAFELQAC